MSWYLKQQWIIDMVHEMYIDISINGSEYTAAVEFDYCVNYKWFDLLKLTIVEDKSDVSGLISMDEVENDIIEQLQKRKAEWLR